MIRTIADTKAEAVTAITYFCSTIHHHDANYEELTINGDFLFAIYALTSFRVYDINPNI